MFCYFRHLGNIFTEAGITVTTQNKKQVDETIHKLIGTHYKDCPATWREFKQKVLADEKSRREFAIRLKEALK